MGSKVLQQAAPVKCSECHHNMRSPAVCSHCHTLYTVDDVNHFELFGLDAKFDIDPQRLQQRYLELAREVHPDRVGGQGPEAQLQSLRTTSQLNRARTVLLSPVLRASYLLEMAGGESAAQNKQVPQDVLMDTLELREALEEAQAAEDGEKLDKLKRDVSQRRDAELDQIGALARQLPGDDALRNQLREKLNTYSYYQKMLEQLS
jgi:molecular chaperone HscB